jgi:hypothetical protein
MPQTIALQARAPQVDLGAILRNGQEYRRRELAMANDPLKNQLEAAKLNDDIGAQSALSDYREAVAAKEPAAIEKLNAYPEQQKKLFDAFDGMEPSMRMERIRKANAFGEAAKAVMSYEKGSEEQAAAWAEQVGKLAADGHIDKTTADRLVKQGPSDAILNEAMTLGELTKAYLAERKGKPLQDARIEDIGLDNVRADRKTDAQIEQGDVRAGATAKNADSLEDYRTAKVGIEGADKTADNERGDKDLERKFKETEARIAKGAKTKEADGLRIEKGISDLLKRKREELALKDGDIADLDIGKSDPDAFEKDVAAAGELARKVDEYRAYEKDLRRKYEVKGANPDGKGALKPAGTARDNPITPKTRAEAMALPKGTWFIDPKGNLIQR